MLRTTIARLAALAAAGALAATIALGAPAPAAAAPAAAPAASAQAHPARPGAIAVRALIRITADLTGQEPLAVRQALVGGQSLAQFAAANGSSGDAVVKAAVDAASERVAKAVERGRITQERADAMIAELTAKATELVNDTALGTKLPQRQP